MTECAVLICKLSQFAVLQQEGAVLIICAVILSVMACLCLTAFLFGVFCCAVRRNRKRFRELSDELNNNVRQLLLPLIYGWNIVGRWYLRIFHNALLEAKRNSGFESALHLDMYTTVYKHCLVCSMNKLQVMQDSNRFY